MDIFIRDDFKFLKGRKMKNMRTVFRNPASDILLVIGLMISCIILLNISDLVTKIADEQRLNKEYANTSSIVAFGSIKNEEISNLTNYLIDYLDNVDEGNIYIIGKVKVDGYKFGSLAAHFLMEKNEDLKFSFKEGGYRDNIIYHNAVIVGESLEDVITEKDGQKYISIDGEMFNVIGILKNSLSSGVDTSLYILWDTMTDETKEQWTRRDFYEIFNRIFFESDIYMPVFLQELRTNTLKYGIQFEEFEDDVDSKSEQINETFKLIRISLLGGSLIFSIVICFSISYLWLLNRRQELGIRISYGYSKSNIFSLLLKDILKIMAIALTIAITIQLVNGVVLGNEKIVIEKFIENLLLVFIGSLAIVLLNIWYLMKKINKFSVTMINEEK